MATHPSILACKMPRTEEPGSVESMRLQRVGHDGAHTQSYRVTDQGSQSTVTFGLLCKHSFVSFNVPLLLSVMRNLFDFDFILPNDEKVQMVLNSTSVHVNHY